MNWQRVVRHLAMPPWRLRQLLPPASMRAIEAAIVACEQIHGGQVRFAVESALELAPLLRGQDARSRAIEVFAQLRVWDTAGNNGVLIYLLLADRDVEIVADRGVHACVDADGWEQICRAMEARFRAGEFEHGVIGGIRAVGELLALHFPRRGDDELANRPVVL